MIIALTMRSAKASGSNTNQKKIMAYAKLALKKKLRYHKE